jgi:protein O-mannosyl-transferase
MHAKRIFIWPVFLVLLVPFLVYLPSLGNEFVALDDELLIVDNPVIKSLDFASLWTIFTSYDPELYIPLTLLSYQIEHALFGLWPNIYHFTNLLLHIGSSIFVYLIISHFFGGRSAIFCSLLFALHPLNTEAVAWASARKDVLSGFFFFLSLVLYLQYRSRDSIIADSDPKRFSNRYYGRGRFYWGSVVAFLFALMSKVSVLMLPFILLLIDFKSSLSLGERARERGWKILLTDKIPYFLLAIFFFIIALFGKGAQTGDLWTPIALSFISVPFYVQKFVLPTGLSILYPFTDAVTLAHPRILIGLLLIVGVTGGAWYLRKKVPVLLCGWLMFLICLVPSFFNVAKGNEGGMTDLYFASDRYAYLAMVGLLFIVGWLIKQCRPKITLLLFIIIPIFGYLTYMQSLTWRNSEALFEQVVASQDNSHIAYNNLAGLYVQQGDVQKGLALFEKSLEIKRTWRTVYNLAKIYAALEDERQSLKYYEEFLEMQPRHAFAHAQAGGLYMRIGNIPQALDHLEKAKTLNPDLPSVHYNLGLIYTHFEDTDRARESFKRVLELDPGDQGAIDKLNGL